jgi:hypothetical protein
VLRRSSYLRDSNADRTEIRALVTGSDDSQDTRFGRSHQRKIVGCRELQHRAADRVIDNVDAICNGCIDRVGKIGCVAACPLVAGAQPTRFINGNSRPWRYTLNATDKGAENRRLDTIARRRGCGMGAMTVSVSRREYFSVVDRAGGLCAVNEIPRTDQLVVAISFGKALSGLTDSTPLLGRFENDPVFELFEATAQPAAEQGILSPVTLTHSRPISFFGVA